MIGFRRMAKSIYPHEAKAIIFVLTNQEKLLQDILPGFEKLAGPKEIQSHWYPFEQSHYYEKELGKNLKRCLISFQNIFKPHRLAELKQLARQLELRHSDTPTLRTINIDPGYVDLFKVVLASGKAGGQKLALSEDVYAYTLLRYEKGKWLPFEWTYPDLKEPTYHGDLIKIRNALKRDLTDRL